MGSKHKDEHLQILCMPNEACVRGWSQVISVLEVKGGCSTVCKGCVAYIWCTNKEAA